MYKGTFDCIAKIAQKGGMSGLYSGVSAGILRQLTYGGPRMAIYPMLVINWSHCTQYSVSRFAYIYAPLLIESTIIIPFAQVARFKPKVGPGETAPPDHFLKKLALGGSAGAIASMTGVPSEVVLVRMAADNKLKAVRTSDKSQRSQVLASPHLTPSARQTLADSHRWV